MDPWGHIAELFLIVVILVLRRYDEMKLRTRLARVADQQGKLVDFVRSSLRPPALRCGQCEHEQAQHFASLGQASQCLYPFCCCPAWCDPVVELAAFEDEPTPRSRRVQAR